jgi:hypothetical protein
VSDSSVLEAQASAIGNDPTAHWPFLRRFVYFKACLIAFGKEQGARVGDGIHLDLKNTLERLRRRQFLFHGAEHFLCFVFGSIIFGFVCRQ